MGMAEPAPARKGHAAALYLIAFAVAVATPLLLLVGALLYRSVMLERAEIRQRIGQVLEALTADIDRDMERRVALLETLSTSPLLAAEDWPASTIRPRRACAAVPTSCWSPLPMAAR